MSPPAPILTQGLLDQLEVCWRSQGAPIVDALNPGLSADAMDLATEPLGLKLPVEAKLWWSWHDGSIPVDSKDGPAPQRNLGPDSTYLTLDEAIEQYRLIQRLATEIEEIEPLHPRNHFPILVTSSGSVRVDCNVQEGAATPIYWVATHDYDIDGATRPKARSFGEMVTWWIEALNDGIWQWDPVGGTWLYRMERLSRERDLSRLV